MKKLPFYLVIMVLSLSAFPTKLFAAETNINTAKTNPKEVPAEIQKMLDRLEEIKEIDKSSLTRVEKKEIRKEVIEIKTNLKSSGHGVYLSVGAIIIIILLLILLV
jgi:hypothetical protein